MVVSRATTSYSRICSSSYRATALSFPPLHDITTGMLITILLPSHPRDTAAAHRHSYYIRGAPVKAHIGRAPKRIAGDRIRSTGMTSAGRVVGHPLELLLAIETE